MNLNSTKNYRYATSKVEDAVEAFSLVPENKYFYPVFQEAKRTKKFMPASA